MLLVISAKATVTFSGAELKMKPGATAQIELSMTNDAELAGFQLDIVLPEGITVQGTTKKKQTQLCGILEELEFDYTVGTTSDGNYGIRVYSTDGLTIDPSEGKIITVNVKADENMAIGEKEIRLTNIILSQGGQAVDLEDVTFKVIIYQEYSFSVSSANETMGSVTGENGTYESGTTITVSATANEGYHFVNWTSGETVASTESSYSFAISGNLTLVANFAPNQYAMTFVLGNGEENVVKTQDYGSELTAPTGFARTGYTFAGWNPEVPATVPAQNQTFTAQWERNSYKLTWDVDGMKTETTIAFEAPITKPEDPQKEGYTFAGWTPEVAETMPAEDVTYTATWTVNQYTISYDLAGGALAEGVSNPASYTIESESITLANPTRVGYTFAGWTGSDLTEATQTVIIATGNTGNRSYTATWTVNQYTMTFVLDNGQDNIVKLQDYASELTAPADVQKTGFTFKGWTPEVPATVPAQDQTFTAQWERNSYKLTWDVDGVKTESTVAFEAPITKPEDPQKEGYTFAGWTPEVAETMPAEDVTYTATWTVNQYTMTFVLDNGEENVVKVQDYASELIAPADVQKTGFTFKGWTPEVPATVPAQDQTFTAQWERNSYKLTWDVDGVKTESTVAFEAPITKPEDPQKEGYTFAGWTPEVAETMPAEDVTYTAQWEVNVYAIVYMVNGVEWARDSVAYGDEVVLRDYKELGSMYEGWLFQDGESYQTMPAHDVIVVAAISTGVDYLRQDKQLVDVYDIRGRLVRRNMNITDMRKSLPAGVYIVAGRKIVIR